MTYSEPPVDQFDQFDQAWPARDLRPGESQTAEQPDHQVDGAADNAGHDADERQRDWDVRVFFFNDPATTVSARRPPIARW